MSNLKLASFFSGIGGFEVGFERTGFETVFQCEINDFCRTILERHWPGVPRPNNIKEVTNASIPLSGVWTGGFPCQDVSVARMGPRDGLRGKQSGLFFEFARLLAGGRPRVVVIENVPGLLSSHQGRDFGIVIRTLADLGYGVGWRVLNSRYFGVPQSRSRVYIVGTYRDGVGPGQILFERERRSRNSKKGGSDGKESLSPFKKSAGDPREGPVTPELAYCLYACSARHTGTDWSRNYVAYPVNGRVRRYTPLETERLQGFADGWTIPTGVENDATDEIDTQRYHALGNAVTPNVAEWLAGRVRAYLETDTVEVEDELLQAVV